MDIVYYLESAPEGVGNPAEYIRGLGISFKSSSYNTISAVVVFHECRNVHEGLPEWITVR